MTHKSLLAAAALAALAAAAATPGLAAVEALIVVEHDREKRHPGTESAYFAMDAFAAESLEKAAVVRVLTQAIVDDLRFEGDGAVTLADAALADAVIVGTGAGDPAQLVLPPTLPLFDLVPIAAKLTDLEQSLKAYEAETEGLRDEKRMLTSDLERSAKAYVALEERVDDLQAQLTAAQAAFVEGASADTAQPGAVQTPAADGAASTEAGATAETETTPAKAPAAKKAASKTAAK